MILSRFHEIIVELISLNYSHSSIQQYISMNFNVRRGISLRSIRRYITDNQLVYRPNNDQLDQHVSQAITEGGVYYGRRMLQGTLRSNNIHAGEGRIRNAMLQVDPVNYNNRRTDSNRRFNPVPYNSQYFGHKLHIDCNEKLVHYGCVLIGAIDGYSGMIVSLFAVHRKNCVDVCEMYRELIKNFGLWDQIRVDHGREFYLMCYLQFLLRDYRYNTNRNAYVQTSSRMVIIFLLFFF